MGIRENLAVLAGRIEAACVASGRDASEVRLLPVSKTKPAAAVLEAFQAGCRRFGENKVQEAQAKHDALADVAGLEWAIIGHLQTNKARYVADFAVEFQALDSIKVAQELDKRLQQQGRALDVLVQVNSSGEPSKFGLAPADVIGFARQLDVFHSLRVRGLMTLALPSDDQQAVADCFLRMRRVQQQLRDEGVLAVGWDELSMGMSGDFELAIAHGSTCVRLGQAIFGGRVPGVGW